jgi:predicted N-acetyltransferase YhbS
MITLRDARADEIEVIQTIEHAAAGRFNAIGMFGLDDPADSEDVAEAIAARQVVVACDGAGGPLGYVRFRPLDEWAYIAQIDVLPSCAGRRIGAALLDEVSRRVAGDGLQGLVLSTFRDIPWNGPYYARLGFVEIPDAELSEALQAIRAEHISWGLDETRRVFMQRPLTPSG